MLLRSNHSAQWNVNAVKSMKYNIKYHTDSLRLGDAHMRQVNGVSIDSGNSLSPLWHPDIP